MARKTSLWPGVRMLQSAARGADRCDKALTHAFAWIDHMQLRRITSLTILQERQLSDLKALLPLKAGADLHSVIEELERGLQALADQVQ